MTTEARDAHAEAKAAKARAKALRPWYRKKRSWLLGIIGVVVLIIILVNVTSGHSTPTNDAASASTAPPTTASGTPGLNQVALDGDFAFTVTSMQCGLTTIGQNGITKSAPAGSQWCLVNMTVKNDKTVSQTFFSTNQKAIDAHGVQLSADTDAVLYLPNDTNTVSAEVNPGVTIKVTVPFQLASTDSIKQVVLHDSAFSDGVTVNVG
jgi:hypothetical protein